MVPYEYLEARATDSPDVIALVCGDETASFLQLRTRAFGLASLLAQRGVRLGDVGATILENSIEFAVAYFACSYLGALFFPLDPRLADSEVARLTRIAEPKFLVTSASHESLISAVVDAAQDCRIVVVAGEDEIARADIVQIFISKTSPSDRGKEFTPTKIGPEDATALLTTSGTTGQPKLAALPARAWDLFQYALETWWHVKAGDTTVVPVPMSHISGPLFLNCCVYFPSTLVILKRCTPRRLVELARDHRPVFCHITPSMARLMIDQLSAEDLQFIGRTMRVTVFGAPMPESYLEDFREKVGAPPHSGYGLTEAAPITTLTPADIGIHRAGSIGTVIDMPGHQVRVVNDDGTGCEIGEIGEIIIGGPSVMLGYHGDTAATAEILRDGWLYTGDLGRFDEEGYLYIAGRRKEIVLVHGLNVLPTEVESAMRTHPGIEEAAVVGERDERSGERVVAYAVRVDDADVDVDELKEFLRQQLAEYKVPREIRFLPELPKTLSGKIDRDALRGLLPERESS